MKKVVHDANHIFRGIEIEKELDDYKSHQLSYFTMHFVAARRLYVKLSK